MWNIDFSQHVETQETTWSKDLEPYVEEFLKDVDNPEEAKKNADQLQENLPLLQAMSEFVDNKIQNILENWVDKSEYKDFIACHHLSKWYNLSLMPHTEVEQEQRVKQIQECYKNLEIFENLNTSVDKDIDKINSFDTSNPTINKILENTWQKPDFILSMKSHQLSLIRCELWPWTIPMSPEHLAVTEKEQEIMHKHWNTNKSSPDIIKSPDQCQQLIEAVANIWEVTTYEQYLIKEFVVWLIMKSLPHSERDIHHDDLKWNNNSNTLGKDNIILEKNSNWWITMKNSLTWESIFVDQNLFKQWKEKEEQRENDRDLIHWFGKDLMLKHLWLDKEAQGKSEKERSKMINEKRDSMPREQQDTLRQKVIHEAIIISITDRNDVFESLRRQNEEWRNQFQLFNNDSLKDLAQKYNINLDADWDGASDFDISKGRVAITTQTIDGHKIFQIKQGQSTIDIGFNYMKATIIKMDENQTRKLESDIQTSLAEDNTTMEKAKEQNPNIYRAIENIKNPEYNEHFPIPSVNLEWYDLTPEQLQTLIPELEKIEGKFRLNISGNDLEHLPKSLFEIKNLSTIDASNNNLTSLPNIESNSNHISHLSLWNNNFSYLSWFDQFRELESLNMGNNMINNLSALKWLHSLERVNFDNNNITELDWIIENKSISHLSLNGNKISTIPDNFTSENLQTLNLWNNNLSDKSWHINLSWFPNISSITIEDNSFSHLPIYWKSTTIKKLFIEWNNFDGAKLPNQIKNLMPNIEKIDFYEHVLPWNQAKKFFLNGDLSMSWFNIQNSKAEQLANFFDTHNNIAYGIWYASSEWESQKNAEKQLQWLQFDTWDTKYITRKSDHWYQTYAITSASELNDSFF